MKKAARRWTEEEDHILRKAVAKYKENESIVWHEVASNFTDRNNKDCRKRWVYTLAPSIKKGAWDDSEDSLLQQGIEKHGYKWALVSQVVGSRQPDQCSRRWHETLNPNITHSRWSIQEDQKLKEAVQMYGRRWTEIVERYFPDRTPIAAKNRYTQRFASRSSNGSPAGRGSSVRPESRAQSISSSIEDDEDVYLQTVPDLMWRSSDNSHAAQRPVAMSMTPAQHFRAGSQLGQLQTQGFPVAPSFAGATMDGFIPQAHPSHKAYSSSGASVYDSSPNSAIDIFSPQSATQTTSTIDTPMELSPEGYFPQIAGQGMMHHSRHPSMAHTADPMMIHPDLDSTLLDNSMLDMHHFVQSDNSKAMGHNFNEFTPTQHSQVDMTALHGHYFQNGGNVMH